MALRSAITPEVWHHAMAPLEGRVYHMYLDILGLVTVGTGNLIDPIGAALALPFKHADGRPTTTGEIAAAWRALKARPELAHRHYNEAGKLNDLRLDDAAIDALVWRQVLLNDSILRGIFRDWDTWPADAQFASHSMAWAVGAGWARKFPNCRALLDGREFERAGMTDSGSGVESANTPSGMRVTGSAPCDIRTTGNPGVIPRNALNRLHFIAAGSALARQYPDVLHGPCTIDAIKAGWKPVADPLLVG